MSGKAAGEDGWGKSFSLTEIAAPFENEDAERDQNERQNSMAPTPDRGTQRGVADKKMGGGAPQGSHSRKHGYGDG